MMYKGVQKGEIKMADTKKVTINGVEMEAADGQTVLQLLNNTQSKCRKYAIIQALARLRHVTPVSSM